MSSDSDLLKSIAVSTILLSPFIFFILYLVVNYWKLPEKRGEVLVVKKSYTPAHYESESITTFDPSSWTFRNMDLGKTFRTEKWWFSVRFDDNKKCKFSVGRDFFDSLKEGDKIKVWYSESRITKTKGMIATSEQVVF
jgi:hypothetical protein